VALALSLAAHLAVVTVLLWRPAPLPSMAPAPTIELELATPPRVAAGPARARLHRPSPAPIAKRAGLPPPAQASAVPSAVPSLVPPADPAPAASASNALRNALRGSVGCDHAALAGLSPSERQKCADRIAQGLAAPAGRRFGPDPARIAAFAAEAKAKEPFLIRPPKDNCMPRVTQQDVGQGAAAVHDWRAGIKCAKSF
jgi:hypothetical protein